MALNNYKDGRVLQINVGRARLAHDLTHVKAAELEADLLVVAEPNKKLTEGCGWVQDKSKDVAVFFRNRDVGVRKIIRESGYIVVELNSEIAIVACYISPNIPVIEYRKKVKNKVNAAIKQRNYLIVGDISAKSSQWGSPINDERGDLWDDWMAQLNIICINNGKPTFLRGASRSHIDVTLAIITPYNLSEEQRLEAASLLFPTKKKEKFQKESDADIPLFTTEEILAAAKEIKQGKAPGPDGLPPEIVKTLITTQPDLIKTVFNELLCRQKFPKELKIANLVLLLKPGKPPDSPASYRPVCLLNCLGKYYEILIKKRLEKFLDSKTALSKQQYGFRRGRSAVDAAKWVHDAAKASKKRWVVLIMLDIQNAFNSANWELIIQELNKIETPVY
ncbi:uncharacterized protein LOC130900280 [Diorhabda carinulata]|uniref:uncharacterized protein LOC130900280 n=1 Tax=Diorhabda carinulata TaxID=1163345 RepID=UPI0025A01E9C|nr:uncharacterized protein LOC130900280 [Diorhabda carinulata]